jgi:sialidase-1
MRQIPGKPGYFLALVVGLFCFLAFSTDPATSQAAGSPAAFFSSTNLWNGGVAGYETYRIPGIVATKRGTILAYTSARRNLDLGDWSDIDIVLRRSTDDGRTWEPSRRLAGDSHGTTDNPIAIVDQQTGAIHFLFQKNYARCFYMRSDDDGRTFSKPVDITYVFEKFRPEYDWHVIAPGVGHAIQLRNGRLLVPIWMAIGTAEGPIVRAHRPSAVATIYSDDHGKTWKRGDIIASDSPEYPNPSESMAVQLADGSVMINMRNESPSHRRLVATSPDGISHWSKPQFDDQLFEPVCAASIIRYSLHPPSDRNRILFSNPDSSNIPGEGNHRFRARQNLSVRMSYDEGKTWPVERVIDPGVTGYSDLAVGPDGTIYCLYEAGAVHGSQTDNPHMTLARFNLAYVLNQPLPEAQ